MRSLSFVLLSLLALSSLFTSSTAAPSLSTDPDKGEWIQYSKRQTVPHFANRNYKTVRGVNLGGWFVLESWLVF